GPEHPQTLATQAELASLLAERGKWTEAEKLFQQVLIQRRKTLAADHLDLAAILADLGDQLTHNGQPVAAERLLRECQTIREKKLPPGHWRIADVKAMLGGSLAQQEKFSQAEPLLLGGYEGLIKSKASPVKQVARALDRLIALYEKWGKPEQAKAWREKRLV